MTVLKRILPVIAFAGFLCILGAFFSHPMKFGFCTNPINTNPESICWTDSFINRGWSLTNAGEFFFVTALVLLFANETSFKKWLRFSYWFVPFAALFLIAFTPIALPAGAQIDTARVTDWLGYVYVFFTFGFVLAGLRTESK